jgi:hypothetical protein
MAAEEEQEEPEEEEKEEEQRDDLVDLLQELRRLLDDVLEDEERAVGEFVPSYLYGLFREAQGEVSVRFDEIIKLIRSGDYEGGLKDHGLRGPSFRLKAEGFWRNARAFFSDPSRRWLRKALGWGNDILKSLAAVLPQAGIIQEFKEALERAVNDKEDGESELAAQRGPPVS